MSKVSTQQDIYTSTSNSAQKIVDGVNELINSQELWNANGWGTPKALPDGAGANEGLTATDLGPAIFASANAIIALQEFANLLKLL